MTPSPFPALAPSTAKLPYSIRVRGWRLARVVLGYGVFLGVALFALYLASFANNSLGGSSAALAAVAVLLGGFCIYRLWLLRTPAVILFPDRIEKRELLGWRTLARTEIEGVTKTISTRSGSYFEIVPRPGAGRRLRLDGWMRDDPVVADWLRGAPDPEAEAIKADRAAILADPRYGPNEAARAARLAFAKTLAQGFTIGCIVLAPALGFFAPLTPLFVLIAALPIAVAAALVAWSDGLILWTAVARARPAVLAAVLPLGAMAFRAFLLTHLVAFGTFLPISAVAGAAAAALFITRPDMAKTVQSAIFFGLFAAIGAYGLAVLADVAFDTSKGQTNATTVRDKHVSRGKSTTYYLQLGPWAGQPGGDTNVSEALYDEVPVGGFVCVIHHPGALGVIWYDVVLCPGEKPLQAAPAPQPPPPPSPGAGEDRFYPDRAQRMGVEGSAIVECTVTDTLQLAACHTLAETPPGYGFGDAAVARLQAPSFKLTRLPKDGARTFRTGVRFQLRR